MIPFGLPDAFVALQRKFKLQGSQKFVLDNVVVPTIQIADEARGSEPAAARSWVVNNEEAAVAGQNGYVAIMAPPGIVIRIDGVFFTGGTSGAVVMGQFGNPDPFPAGGTPISPAFTDQRSIRVQGPSYGKVESGTSAAVGALTPHWRAVMGNWAEGGMHYAPIGWFVSSAPLLGKEASDMALFWDQLANDEFTFAICCTEYSVA